MNETAVRDLLQQAMDGDEPPIGPQIVSGAVRAASRTRRRQLAAGIGVTAAIVPALAFGVPAAAGALAPAAPSTASRWRPVSYLLAGQGPGALSWARLVRS